jgi:hypothetical protein
LNALRGAFFVVKEKTMALLVRVLSSSGFDTNAAITNPPALVVAGEALQQGQGLEIRADGKAYKFTGLVTSILAGVASSTVPVGQATSLLRQGSRFWVGATITPGVVYYAAPAGEWDTAPTAGDTKGAVIAMAQLDAVNNITDLYFELIRVGKNL